MLRALKQTSKRLLDKLYFPPLIRPSIRRLRAQSAAAYTVADYISLVYGFSYGPPVRGLQVQIRPEQVRSEIIRLLELLEPRQPRLVCEVGTASGGTLFLFTRIAHDEAELVSIDLPWPDHPESYVASKEALYASFARNNQTVTLMRTDSHAQDTLERVKRWLNGRQLDLLFIDGDHSYEGVSQDFTTYSRFVKTGGLVALHDIVPGPNSGGVPRFWLEIKTRHNTDEIIEDSNQQGSGIGVVYYASSHDPTTHHP